jgi:hypothetical protein
MNLREGRHAGRRTDARGRYLMDGFDQVVGRLTPETFLNVFLAATLLFHLAWGLLSCFLGYIVARVCMAIAGLIAGAAAGLLLSAWLLPGGPMLAYAAAIVAAIPGAYLCWRFYRLTYAVYVAANVAVVFACGTALMPGAGSVPPAVGLVFAGVFGVGFGVLAFLFAKHLIIILSALGGAFTTVFSLAVLVANGPVALAEVSFEAGLSWAILPLAAMTIILASFGAYVQYRVVARMEERAAERKAARPAQAGKKPASPRRPAGAARPRPATA